MEENKLQRYEKLRSQLEQERSSFIPHWRELSEYILPRRSRFLLTDTNRGERRNQKIIDSTATLAVRTLRSGMVSGVTSPARPWFRLTTPDPSLAEFGPVKKWLHTVGQRMSTVFLRSNLYQTLPTIYGDIGTFATGSMMLEEDLQDVVRFYSHPIGSYMIANDHRLRVNTFVREFRMTVRQLVEQFGERDEKTGRPLWERFSNSVREAWEKGQTEQWVDVVHVIRPNDDYRPESLHSQHKLFASCYYEKGQNMEEGRFLREKGYDYFPVLCPRWEVTGEDVYGTDCPGMTSLGDVKAVQTMEKRAAETVERRLRPPMIGPTRLRNSKASILPGDVTYDDSEQGRGFRPAYEVNLPTTEIENLIQKHDQRIQRAFYEDLFLMLANDSRSNITAREIEERHEEKLLALGPVLEQLNQDLLDPLIDNTFNLMIRQSDFEAGTGPIPKPPEELAGLDLKVEYQSVMAQAQKLVGIAGHERFIGMVGQIAAFDPGVIKKVNLGQFVDTYGDMTSVNPAIIRGDDEVEEMEQAERQAQAAQQQAEMLNQATSAAKNLSQADMQGDNALTRMIDSANAGALTEPQ